MHIRKYRWSKTYESAEEELVALLELKQITASRWSLEAFEQVEPHTTTADKRIWCAEGSIVFTLNDQTYTLQPGDTIDIPAGTVQSATAGLNGYSCYESPVPADKPADN